jgi:hypothetical protein
VTSGRRAVASRAAVFSVIVALLLLASAGWSSHVAQKHAEGSVVSVDRDAYAIKIRAGNLDLSFTAATKAAREGLEKLKSGDRVKVFYTTMGKELLALSFDGAPAAAPSGEATVAQK